MKVRASFHSTATFKQRQPSYNPIHVIYQDVQSGSSSGKNLIASGKKNDLVVFKKYGVVHMITTITKLILCFYHA
jgi:hypothetical protein